MNKTYVPAPTVPPDARLRIATVVAALSGTTTVSAAARALGVSRNRFQSVMHRGFAGLIAALLPAPPGRPPKSTRERELAAENAKLRRQNASLSAQRTRLQSLLETAGQALRAQATANLPRRRRRVPTPRRNLTTTPKEGDDEDLRTRALALATTGLRLATIACAICISPSTLWRWRSGVHRRAPTAVRSIASSRTSNELVARVADTVRATRGLAGAESLRRSVDGAVSRRHAAAIKRATLTALERERVAACRRVIVTAPGIVRGFDAMYLSTARERRYLLVAADACVPYRTSAPLALRYDAAAVAAALAHDFRDNGVPLVVRMDRARIHDAPEVRALLDDAGVLVLHGPAYYPRFYGQLERQNREHRAWFAASHDPLDIGLEHERDQMLDALNGIWRRPSLGWKTAAEVWAERTEVTVDRVALRKEVHEHVERLRRERRDEHMMDDGIERIAIERTLTNQGYLRVERRVGC